MSDTTPTCPICRAPMTIRKGSFGQFYGCTNFRKGCRGNRKINYTHTAKAITAAATEAVIDFTPTGEQLAIWDEMATGDSHIVVKAYAGSGKSSTCRIGMFKLDRSLSIFYGCFGKKNTEDMTLKGVPANATVSTLNSLGGRAVRNAFPKSRLNEDKVWDILHALLPEIPKQDKAAQDVRRTVLACTKKLVDLCRGYLVDGTDAEVLTDICIKHDIEIDTLLAAEVFPLVPRVLDCCRTQTNTHDFNDQLWLPVVLGLPCNKFDVVIVDEAQDMNPCQHKLVLAHLHDRSRCIIIGDDYQAIFGFRGSDTESMDNMAAALATTSRAVKTLTLSISQRCPVVAIALVNQWVPGIRAAEGAKQGNIYDVDSRAAFGLYRPGDMVLCRCNAPLTRICYRLIQQGVKAVILGKDIGLSLKALIGRLNAGNNINDMLVNLERHVEKEIAKVRDTKLEDSVTQRLGDQAECITVLADGCDTVDALCLRIDTIFAPEQAGQPVGYVTLSSVHKAKGLENNRVFWIRPDIRCKGEQEENIFYVAGTRTKDKLYRVWEPGTNPRQYPAPEAVAAV